MEFKQTKFIFTNDNKIKEKLSSLNCPLLCTNRDGWLFINNLTEIPLCFDRDSQIKFTNEMIF